MDTQLRTHATLALALLLGAAGASAAQQPGAGSSDKTPPAQGDTQDQSQSQSGDQPKHQNRSDASAPRQSDSNAFPEAESERAAKRAQQEKQDDAHSPPAPDSQQSSADGSGGDNNAFPEDASRKAAADAAKAKAAENNASSSSGVSSSGDYDTSVNGRNAITPNVSMSHIHNKDSLKEDVQVGSYYLQSGNFPGAYSRFKEASTLHPESTDAIFGLAEAARHLHKNDEALSNYQLFLDIVPSGAKAKDARKALASLEKGH